MQRRSCKIAGVSGVVRGVEDFCDGSQRMIRQLGVTQTSFGTFPKNNTTQRVRHQMLRSEAGYGGCIALRLSVRVPTLVGLAPQMHTLIMSCFLALQSSKTASCRWLHKPSF